MSDPSQSTQRVRVTSTRRDATTRRDLRPLTREIDEQSNLGEVFVAGLMSAQLRLANRADLDATVAAARKAADSWGDISLAKRTAVLFKFRELVAAHVDDLAELITA